MSKKQKHSKSQLVDIGPEGMLPAFLIVVLFLFLLTPLIINDNNKQRVRGSQKVELSKLICPCQSGGIKMGKGIVTLNEATTSCSASCRKNGREEDEKLVVKFPETWKTSYTLLNIPSF